MGTKPALLLPSAGFLLMLALLAAGCRSFPSATAPESPLPSAVTSADSAKPHRWTFVVMGDTRDATRDTLTGISPALHRIAAAVAAEKPELVIHDGDLINGFYTNDESPVHGKFLEMFDNWKKAMGPIYDFNGRTGIPLYVVRGNHEDGFLFTDKKLKDAYEASIAPFMPQNGPDKEKGLTYSFRYGQACFFALDEYSIKEWGGLRGLVDQPWMDDQLARNQGRFKFVFGHMPAFKVSTFKTGPFPDLYDFPEHRDVFWASLKKAGVTGYFCGHVHFYCRVTKEGIPQIVVGNGGANLRPFDPEEVDRTVILDYPKVPVTVAEMKVGYLLITVDEQAQTVTAVQKLWSEQTGSWEIGDTFMINKALAESGTRVVGADGLAGLP
jgi:hypothetical protein